MYCEKCGEKLEDNVKFCPKCGAPVAENVDFVKAVDNVLDGAENEARSAIKEVRNAVSGNDNSGVLKENWGLLSYVLLSFITCGIYGWYTIYKLSNDINIACNGDGENTSGLVKTLMLTIITCGIYGWIWHYKLGNRLAKNASRYNLTFQENGTTVLLWMLFGSMLCGVGPFIAMHIIFKNMNLICHGYNTYSHI